MTHLFNSCLLAAVLAAPVAALEAATPALPADTGLGTLDTVVVTGRYPAPGLWELHRNGKTLLIMGTLTPAPKRMEWSADRVSARIAEAGLVLGPPGVSVGADVGLFRGAMLWPAYRRSKRNPGNQELSDVLSAPVYERWEGFRQRYLPRERSVERLRPMHAAKELFDAAVRQAGMTDKALVEPVVREVAKKHDIPVRSTALRLTIDDPKTLLKQLNATDLEDEDCLVQTMDRLNEDLATMAVRANAWAEGDVEGLRALPFVDQKRACRRALASNRIAQVQGMQDLDARVQGAWLAAVDKALSEHTLVFATVPVARLLEHDGLLSALEREGFTVKSPE